MGRNEECLRQLSTDDIMEAEKVSIGYNTIWILFDFVYFVLNRNLVLIAERWNQFVKRRHWIRSLPPP